MKMLTSTALALIMFFIQDTSWKPALFVSASEDSNPSANRVDVEDYTAPTGTTRLVERDGNMRDCFNCHYFHLSKPISYNLDDYISSPEMACKNHSPCHRRPRLIQEYSKKDVVLCLDSLSVKRNRRPMHIAFIGDSIVRHQYLSFLRVGF
uniref:Lactosylceramide-like protein n=1 Tax=Daphnia magna TaxID=35525 RepID=A0A0P6AKI5_9CRUS